VVDIHSHILPEVDDGPKSWDASSRLPAAAADGITHMVATPHANDRYTTIANICRIARSSATAHWRRPKTQPGLRLSPFYDNLQDALAHPTRYVIQGTRYLLVEFSTTASLSRPRILFSSGNCGITPIITHPSAIRSARESAARGGLGRKGCVIQLTALR